MDPLEQVSVLGQGLARASRAGLRRPQWLPWALQVALHALLILTLWGFAHPWLSAVMAPVLAAAAGEAALHYPAAPLAIPGALARIDAACGWLLEPLLLGWSALLFTGAFRGEPMRAGAALLESLRRAPRLIVVGAPLVLVHATAAGAVTSAIDVLSRRPLQSLGAWAVWGGVEAAVITIAVCVLPALVRPECGLGELPESLRRSWRRSGVAAVLAGAAFAASASAARLLLTRGLADAASERPDAAPALALAAALLAAAGGLLFCGASVVMHVVGEETDEWT